MANDLPGLFVTFEGGEGSGKTTQMNMVAKYCRAQGYAVLATREPGGTPLGEATRQVLLNPAFEPDGFSEIFLLEAARRDHVCRVVRPALARGDIVLSDRYADSSTVYQGMVRGLGVDKVEALNWLATDGLQPDITYLLDGDVDTLVTRAKRRGAPGESRIDDEPLAFHHQVRAGFRKLAFQYTDRFVIIDAEPGLEEIADTILEHLVPYIEKLEQDS